MKAFALLLALFTGGLPYTYKYEMSTCPTGAISSNCIAAQTCSGNSCGTGVLPTSTMDGMLLGGVSKYRLTVCAASGQTLSGAGTMQSFTFSTAEGVWDRGNSDANVTTTQRSQSFDFVVGLRFDRVRYVANAVTVSGGATLDVLLEGQNVSTSN